MFRSAFPQTSLQHFPKRTLNPPQARYFFEKCNIPLKNNMFLDWIQAKSISVETFWRQGFVEDFWRFVTHENGRVVRPQVVTDLTGRVWISLMSGAGITGRLFLLRLNRSHKLPCYCGASHDTVKSLQQSLLQ